MERESSMKTFEVGKTYSTRSIGDHNCIIRVTIARRTAKTVTTTEGKTFRPYYSRHWDAEVIRPWGNYSMSPLIHAGDTKELRRDWDDPVPVQKPRYRHIGGEWQRVLS